jgi:hypothetical protein
MAAIHRQAAFLRLSKAVRLPHPGSTSGTLQPFRVKVFKQPPFTRFRTEEINDWKFHTL